MVYDMSGADPEIRGGGVWLGSNDRPIPMVSFTKMQVKGGG